MYDPTSNSFSVPINYALCEEVLNMLAILADPICSGEIPLNIAYDIQPIFYEVCGCAPPNNFFMEVCDNGIDDDGDGLVDCEDPDCCNSSNCNCSEICSNGLDDDGDGLVDCNDPDCCGVGSCTCEENCGNGIDDDGDGLVDENDPNCFGLTSPCMRDHYLEDNYFHEIELQSTVQISAMGGNLCGGVVNFTHPEASVVNLFSSSFGSITALEEWYDFLVKIHWGSANGSTGQFQDLIYRAHIFELGNEPVFTERIVSRHGALIVTLIKPGLEETKPISLGSIPFHIISNVCGVNNWDPGVLGDKVAISVHEFDNCMLQTTTGNVTTTTQVKTYNSSFELNLGLKSDSFPLSGGILYKNSTELANTTQNQISASYQTNYSNDYDIGRLNYGYCWEDQGTAQQIHELPFGNILFLRMMTEKCD